MPFSGRRRLKPILFVQKSDSNSPSDKKVNFLSLIMYLFLTISFCNLSEYSDILERCFTTKRSLFSAIKHENIELIDFLNSNLNTVNTNYDEHLSLTSLLNFSMIQGKLKVVKFLCYNLLPFSQNINRCNLLKLELAIEEAVKYNNIECALFVLDYYVFQTKSMNYPKLSISLKDRIRTKNRKKYIKNQQQLTKFCKKTIKFTKIKEK